MMFLDRFLYRDPKPDLIIRFSCKFCAQNQVFSKQAAGVGCNETPDTTLEQMFLCRTHAQPNLSDRNLLGRASGLSCVPISRFLPPLYPASSLLPVCSNEATILK